MIVIGPGIVIFTGDGVAAWATRKSRGSSDSPMPISPPIVGTDVSVVPRMRLYDNFVKSIPVSCRH